MQFAVSVHHGPHYLIVAAVGDGTLSDLCGVCSFAAQVADRDQYSRILMDLLGVYPDLDGKARAILGQHFADTMKHYDRVSIALPVEHRSGIGELIALAAGVKFRLLESLDEATQWLHQP